MNRNTESHFALVPEAKIGRSKFDRSFTHKTTFSAGELIPLFVDATIMPGDTVNMSMSELVRMITPLTPVMDNMIMDTYFFFVPHRLVWDNFKYFMGENTNAWKQTTNYEIPKIILKSPEGGAQTEDKYKVDKGSLLNYMGIPLGLGVDYNTDDSQAIKINALPIRAYAQIWNDWFRDQNTEKETYLTKSNATRGYINRKWYEQKYSYSVSDRMAYGTMNGSIPLPVNRLSDYFSRCLPEPQKGEAVLVPLVGQAPIVYGESDAVDPETSDATTLYGKKVLWEFGSVGAQGTQAGYKDGSGTVPDPYENAFPLTGETFGLYTSMEEAVGATVNSIRQAFAIQKFYERQARGGTRYIEMVKSHFGVTNPDFRLQRSEYLGGKRIPITINQVIQETPTADQELGTTGAYSVTSDVSNNLFTHSFTEHGTLIGLCAVRVVHSYQQGINAQWFMNKLTDFYFPEFANLGDMPVYNREIYAQDGANIAVNDEVFAYQEAWGHYRYMPDLISGELSSLYSQSLEIWHYGDEYDELPTLSADWMMEPTSNITRTLAYQEGDMFKGDFYFKATYTRPMPLYSVPGLVDHH